MAASWQRARFGAVLGLAALAAGCGGGGSSGGTSSSGTGTGTTATPPTASACTLRTRQDWAAVQLREWYLFPETLPATLDPAPYATVDDYIDALTATARAQRRDRFFTFLTSIREEEAFLNSGASAGFGIRLSTDSVARRVFVSEAFEGAPALAAGIDRGAEIVAIGTDAATLRPVADLIATGGSAAVTDALGPTTAGTTRILRIADAAGTRDLTVTKQDYGLVPVSSRYGARIVEADGARVGYLNLRTFIDPAEPALRAAFQQFRDAGVTRIVVDLRYNGGGLVDTAELLGDLLGGARSPSEVFSFTTYRPEKASRNRTRFFAPQPQSASPTRIAFIATGATASASELVINAFIPYLRAGAGLIGANSFGKPVGQIPLDNAACDDRLRVVAFATQNAARQGDYYDGLATKVEASCQAADDLARPLGDPQEASFARALDFLAGRGCTAIGGQAPQALRTATGSRALLTPDRPTVAQREVPGSF